MAEFPKDYRLDLPNVSSNVENTFQLLFYFPNMCHICHRLDSETVKLKRCSGCNMISYCGKEHQTGHWILHKDFCQVVEKLLKDSGTESLFNFMKDTQDPVELLKNKKNLLDTLSTRMKRQLYDFETQMILFPKMCSICFETNPDLLYNCKFCPQVSFCSKHMLDAEHSTVCHFFKLCYTSDFYSLCDDRHKVLPNVKQVNFQNDNFKMPANIKEFMQKCISVPSISIELTKFNFWFDVYTEFFSQSLTLMHVLDQLNFKYGSKLTLHVLDIPKSQELGFLSMEVLLHLISPLNSLTVILVSTNLFDGIEKCNSQVRVCSNCVTEEKKFFLKGFKMPYMEYVSSEIFETPDIVISFDLGNFESRVGNESLLKMKSVSAPLLITNNTLPRALSFDKKMSDLFGCLTSKPHIEKNSFASLWASRDDMNNDLQFSNNYITVYTLHNIEKDVKSKSEEKKEESSEVEIQVESKNEEQKKEEKSKNAEKPMGEPTNVDAVPSVSDSNNSELKNNDAEKSKKKKKKTNQTIDILKNDLSNNDNDTSLISTESLTKNEKSEIENAQKTSPVGDADVLEVTNQLSATNLNNDPVDGEVNLEKLSPDVGAKKKSKKKSKKKKSLDLISKSVEDNVAQSANVVTIEPQHAIAEAETQEKSEQQIEVETEGGKKSRRNRRKHGKQSASPEKNLESSVATQPEVRVVHFSCLEEKNPISTELSKNNESSVNECGASNSQPCEQSTSQKNEVFIGTVSEPQAAAGVFGDLLLSKTAEEFVEENKKLSIEVERLADEYKMMKTTYKSTGSSMLQEMECLRMSLESLEEKVKSMFPEE